MCNIYMYVIFLQIINQVKILLKELCAAHNLPLPDSIGLLGGPVSDKVCHYRSRR